jgi:VCBS repeat-containing protein
MVKIVPASPKRIVASLLAVGAIAGIGIDGAVSQPSQPSGFYNMSTLSQDLEGQYAIKIPGVTATVECLRAGGQTAKCAVTLSNGQAEAVTVTISPDGRTYVTG